MEFEYMYYDNFEIKKIEDAADGNLISVIGDFVTLSQDRSGAGYTGDCPLCHGKNKFKVHPTKGFMCVSCQAIKGRDAKTFLMKGANKTFPEALEFLTEKFHVDIRKPESVKKKSAPKMKKQSKAAKGEDVNSYCAHMLSESGLTFEDVTAKVFDRKDNHTTFECRTFTKGTIDQRGDIDREGDDVIIRYYDLEGFPVTYVNRDAKGRETSDVKEYFRVRWQHPDAHLDKDGKPFKYKSPRGSGTPIYIPQKIRALYNAGLSIDRLYIQEGEKKAEKACKHGIPSVAVSGIQNLGYKGTLPEDLVRIISKCRIKEVVFIFDSDWDDISTNIRINDQVDKRPRCFFYAARMYSLKLRAA